MTPPGPSGPSGPSGPPGPTGPPDPPGPTGRSTPEPRPALRKAADGSVHPAAPRSSSLAVVVERKPASADKKGKKATVKAAAADTVVLSVPVPKSLRKALRRKAEEYGWSPEEAAAHVLRVWVGG